MARKRKVDPVQLERLLRDGFSQREVAEKFGVGEGTISKNVKVLTFCQAQDVVMRSAIKINDKKLNAMATLERVIKKVEDELKGISASMEGTMGEEKREWLEVQLKYLAETRKQLTLIKELIESTWMMEQLREFQELVLEKVKKFAPEAWSEIQRELKQERSDRSIPGIREFTV